MRFLKLYRVKYFNQFFFLIIQKYKKTQAELVLKKTLQHTCNSYLFCLLNLQIYFFKNPQLKMFTLYSFKNLRYSILMQFQPFLVHIFLTFVWLRTTFEPYMCNYKNISKIIKFCMNSNLVLENHIQQILASSS